MRLNAARDRIREGACGRLLSLWLLLLAAPATQAAPPHADAACEAGWPGRERAVEQVTDGDTLKLSDGRHLRVVGLDTPELGRDGRPDAPLARRAATFTRAFVADAEHRVTVRLAEDPEDDHGRLLGHVIADGESLAVGLLEAGLAMAVAIPPNVAEAACLFAAEDRARQAGRGLWSLDASIRDAAALEAGDRGFALVRGTITGPGSAPEAAVTWILDDAFRLEIPPSAMRQHPGFEGLQVGDVIEVRGWVFPNAGLPSIRTRHPLNVQIIEPSGAVLRSKPH